MVLSKSSSLSGIYTYPSFMPAIPKLSLGDSNILCYIISSTCLSVSPYGLLPRYDVVPFHVDLLSILVDHFSSPTDISVVISSPNFSPHLPTGARISTAVASRTVLESFSILLAPFATAFLRHSSSVSKSTASNSNKAASTLPNAVTSVPT